MKKTLLFIAFAMLTVSTFAISDSGSSSLGGGSDTSLEKKGEGAIIVNIGIARNLLLKHKQSPFEGMCPSFHPTVGYRYYFHNNLYAQGDFGYKVCIMKYNEYSKLRTDRFVEHSFILSPIVGCFIPMRKEHDMALEVFGGLYGNIVFGGYDEYGIGKIRLKDKVWKNTLNRFIPGVTAGVALDLSHHFRIAAQFNYDFIDLLDTDLFKTRNSSVEFSIGWGF